MGMRTSFALVWAIAGMIVATGVGCGHVTHTTTEIPESAGNDTSLGVGDIFDVRVFDEAELTGTYRVAQDGSIDFPLVHRVQVAGLEPTQIADMISARLHDDGIMHDPHVSVLVREYNSKRITVLGAVARAGTFPMANGLTAVQAVSLAGGFTSLANRNQTVITRSIAGRTHTYRVRLADIMEGDAEDFALGAGDTLFIPENIF
ncbi:MAG: polysaccharide export protein [Sandaracinaceae bacterium]|jgi:protein involved in polysaccharide export with SLBB domain|nr:polysaccharide export protein [Sandaracinaceae bacterium]